MLDVEKGWEAFNNFENYFFTPDCEDFFQFTGKWNVRHQAAIDVGISYPNSVLAFKLLQNSNLSAPVQSRIISSLRTEFKDDCNIVHLITYLISRETQNKQNFKSVPKQVTSEQSLGCLPIDEKVDIPRELDPLYSDENIKLEYFNVEEEMVYNDKDEGVGEDVEETVTVSVNEGQVYKPGTPDESDLENEGNSNRSNCYKEMQEQVKLFANQVGKDFSPIRSASNITTSTPEISACVKGKSLFEKSENRIDEKLFNTLLESNQNILKVLHGMQNIMLSEFRANKLKPNSALVKPYKHIKTADQLKNFEVRIEKDRDFFLAVKQYLEFKVSGHNIHSAAYKILPEIMSEAFALDISWDKGSGRNETVREIHLKSQFPHFVSMIKEAICRSEKFSREYEASPMIANNTVCKGIAKYLKNIRTRKTNSNGKENDKNKIQLAGVQPVGVNSCRPGPSKEIANPTQHNDIAASSKDLGRTYSTPEEPSLKRRPLLTSTGDLEF